MPLIFRISAAYRPSCHATEAVSFCPHFDYLLADPLSSGVIQLEYCCSATENMTDDPDDSCSSGDNLAPVT